MAPRPSVPAARAGSGLALLDAEDRNRRRAEWRVTGTIVAFVAAASFVFGWTMSDKPDEHWINGVQGIVNSMMASIPIVWLEVSGNRLPIVRRIRQWPFTAFFLLKMAFYVCVMIVSTQAARLIFDPFHRQSFDFDRRFFEILVFGGLMSLVANIIVEIGRLVGFGELRRLLTGRYIRPRQERRVFLMVDMKDSTAAAERLGDIRFHQLLNVFFRNLADAAYAHGAEIHKYIGDEAILTWTEDVALRGARCALCPFAVTQRIERAAGEYASRFGFVPSFRAALHTGEIVAGEVGTMKREIAFTGDTLNTTSRLMGVARESGHDIVMSGDLAAKLHLPAGLTAVALDAVHLRGKEKPLAVTALRLA
jgi:adenylate cyclase